MGGLLRSELHRFRSRRFIQVVLAVGLLGWIAATVIALTQVGLPSEEELARAEQQISQDLEMSKQGREECLQNVEIPPGVAPEQFCGPEPTREDYSEPWR